MVSANKTPIHPTAQKMRTLFFICILWFLAGVVLHATAQEKEKSCLSVDNVQNSLNNIKTQTHNCRFWGMLTNGSYNDNTQMSHLDSLQQLAPSNANGWGFGFYTQTLKGGNIPVTYRGMWRADQDNLYDTCAKMMLNNLSNSGIAHIRNASYGYINIPDPHPFYLKSSQRDFSMLFAHNGGLNIPLLITLLDTFTNNIHYNYSGSTLNDPNLDSDLYSLYLLKWIDKHPSDSITTCLKNALDTLTGQMGFGVSYNFVIATTYDTLWALCYNNTLSYRRENGYPGYFWEVASEPLGGTDWVSASNYYLYIFSTGNAYPDSIQINNPITHFEKIDENVLFNVRFANPAIGKSIEIEIDADESQSVDLQLIDMQGHLLSEKVNVMLGVGENHITFDINFLKSSIYYLIVDSLKDRLTKKIVILNSP